MLGLILNRRAGRSRRWSEQALSAQLGGRGLVRATGNIREIPGVLAEFRQRGCTLLVPIGGDGTLSRTLAAALKTWDADTLPPVLVVRGGTMNMLADHLGTPSRQLPHALAAVLASLDAGHTLPMARRRLLLSDAGPVGFSFGFGAAARFLEHYDRGGSSPGAALGLLGRACLSGLLGTGLARDLLAAEELQVRIDEGPVRSECWSVGFALTIDHLPLRFAVAPGAAADPEHMQLIYGRPSARFVVRHLWDLKRGRPVSGPDFHRDRARSLRLDFSRPQSWMMDGEIYPPCEGLGLQLGPAVRLVVA